MATISFQDYCEALHSLQDQFEEEGIHIYNMGNLFGDVPIRLGVQWPSIGTVAPADTVKFANRLLDASMAAEAFQYNGYTIEHGN